ncbi:MAG: hypothetical protein H7257_12135 [Taibaiella sp.]|nr:hypothetical protein [Taibaiella sp.]
MPYSLPVFSQSNNDLYVLFGQRNYEEAIGGAKQMMDKNNANANSYEITGLAYIMISKFDSAVIFLRQAIDLDKDSSSTSGRAHFDLGYAYYYSDEKEKGIAELQKCITLGMTENSVKGARNFLDCLRWI